MVSVTLICVDVDHTITSLVVTLPLTTPNSPVLNVVNPETTVFVTA